MPVQDLLGLDNEARMNLPGQAEGNWTFRVKPRALTKQVQSTLCALTLRTGRASEPPARSARRKRAMALRIEIPELGEGLQVGLSAGLAALEPKIKNLDELIARGDAALYRAKHEGRDLVRIADESYSTASTAVRRSLR